MKDDLNTASAPENGPWKFDENVTNAFGDMLARSIPGYNDMRDVILRIGTRQLDSITDLPRVVDLGASTGESIAPFLDTVPDIASALLIEVSDPMVEKLQERFANDERVVTRRYDLRARHKDITAMLTQAGHRQHLRAHLVLSILTLIFVPINHRPNIIRGIYDALDDGGMFIMTEKLQGPDWMLDNLLVDTYHQYKKDNGYSWEAIERKRLALEGVQVPLTEESNLQMLRSAGFSHVTTVHKFLNFATFVAIK